MNRRPPYLLVLALLATLAFAAAPAGAVSRKASRTVVVDDSRHEAAAEREQAEPADAHGAGEHAEAAGGHAAEHGEGHDPYHLPNFVGIFFGDRLEGGRASLLDPLFSALAAILLMVVMGRACRGRGHEKPTRFQMAVEMVMGALYDLVEGALGPHARRFTPYLGTLFIFILVNNFLGLVPFMHASTSSINTTIALALCTFIYVQYVGIRENGPLGYLHHLAGSPRSGLEWCFVPLMFPLHLLGEIIKPLSLGLRLFGNVMGEDKLIAVFVVLGAGMLAFVHAPFGIPIQVPIVFLAMLTGTIQALVFALLSTIYIALMLPHPEHGHD